MTNTFNFAGWLNFCKLKKLLSFCRSLSLSYVLLSRFALYHMEFRHYALRVKMSFKIYLMLFDAHWLIKKFHGTFSRVPWNFSWNFSNNICTTYVVLWNSMVLKQHKLKFHGIPLNFVQIQSSMKFHGTFPYPRVPWNSMELLIFPQKISWNSMQLFWSSMEFHDVPWNLINLIFKKSYC